MDLTELEAYRVRHPVTGDIGDNGNGAFIIPRAVAPMRTELRVLVSDGYGWEHVSVSCSVRTPTWDEMEWVKRRSIGDALAIQYHLPVTGHINFHQHTLHLWRPSNALIIPTPPPWMVGPYDGWREEMERDMADWESKNG